jgi:hypothetical protein
VTLPTIFNPSAITVPRSLKPNMVLSHNELPDTKKG